MYKYEILPDGLGYTVDVSYSQSANQITNERKFFFKELSAYHYIESHLASYLDTQFKKMIAHSNILTNTSNSYYYKSERRFRAYERCKEYAKVSANDSLRGISLQILNLEADLRALLPSPSNTSYQHTHDKLEEIVWLCIRIRKQLKKAI
ncbi:MAG: hypothetical protein ACOYMF_14360 [Bacteroidales bacterium]